MVEFHYHSFKSDAKQHRLHPYFLREYKHRWYVIGKLPASNHITVFALDRMEQAPKLTLDRFVVQEEIDPFTYFDQVVGVTVHREKPVEEVILHFSAEQTPYFRSKPFHRYEPIGVYLKMSHPSGASVTYPKAYSDIRYRKKHVVYQIKKFHIRHFEIHPTN